MEIKRLSEFPSDLGPIYLDVNIFLYHFSNDPKFGPNCTTFLNKVEQGMVHSYSSSLVVDEVIFILLRFAAIELLGIDKPVQIIRQLKNNINLLKNCYKKISPSLDYIKSLYEKGVLIFLDFSAPIGFIGYGLGEKYGLLPRDAAHLSLMHSNGITNIASTDEDFKLVDSITIWSP